MDFEDRRQDADSDFASNPFAAPQSVEAEGTMLPTRPGEMTLNPWVSIWTKPRATIRQLIDSHGYEQAPLVVALGGAANGINNSQNLAAPMGVIASLAVGVTAGVVFGFLTWFLGSWLVQVTGKWLGGRASLRETRTAYAWAQVPSIWLAPVTVAVIILGGSRPDLVVEASPVVGNVFIIIGLLMMLIGLWSLIIWCKAIGEAHLFSAWRGLGSLILASLLVSLAVFPLVFLLLAMVA